MVSTTSITRSNGTSGCGHSILGQIWVVCTNQTNQKRCHRHLIMIRCSRMSLEHTTEKMASVSGPFIKWNSRKQIKRVARVFLFVSACCHSVVMNYILHNTLILTAAMASKSSEKLAQWHAKTVALGHLTITTLTLLHSTRLFPAEIPALNPAFPRRHMYQWTNQR